MFQSSFSWWYVLHIVLVCYRQSQQHVHVRQFGQNIPCGPCCLLTVPNRAGDSITASQGMKHWESLCLLGSKCNGHTVSSQILELQLNLLWSSQTSHIPGSHRMFRLRGVKFPFKILIQESRTYNHVSPI